MYYDSDYDNGYRFRDNEDLVRCKDCYWCVKGQGQDGRSHHLCWVITCRGLGWKNYRKVWAEDFCVNGCLKQDVQSVNSTNKVVASRIDTVFDEAVAEAKKKDTMCTLPWPLIRCKNCEFSVQDEETGKLFCACWSPTPSVVIEVNEEGFCSRGLDVIEPDEYAYEEEEED